MCTKYDKNLNQLKCDNTDANDDNDNNDVVIIIQTIHYKPLEKWQMQ